MNALFKLNNHIKHYAWGSPEFLPRLMGITGDGRPWAELWMGVHPGGPSETSFRGKPLALGDLINRDKEAYLGKEAAETFGALPFLFKFLAAASPLSIQAHPNLEQAKEGFARENLAGTAPDAPNRNYKDPNHKPEILCALSPFAVMCGFREPGDIGRNLERFLSPAPASLKRGMAPLAAALTGAGPAGALRAFFTALFELSAETRGELTAYIKKTGEGADPPPPGGEYMTLFAGLYPGDPALIAPLYLNTFELKPGEAVYLDAGVLHAYIRGFGVELMANSDNVLRGGLSPKHIDLPELFRVLDFSPHKPLILKAPEPAPSYYTYPAPCGEFSLSVMTGQGGETPFPETGPSIAVITRGEARVSLPGEEIPLLPGESVFIPARGLNPAGKGEVSPRFSGSFTAYVAAFPGGAPDANTMAQKAAGKGSGGR